MIQPTTALALGQSRLAEFHHQAQRDQDARAAKRARRAAQRGPRHPALLWSAALTRHALTKLGARKPEVTAEDGAQPYGA